MFYCWIHCSLYKFILLFMNSFLGFAKQKKKERLLVGQKIKQPIFPRN